MFTELLQNQRYNVILDITQRWLFESNVGK